LPNESSNRGGEKKNQFGDFAFVWEMTLSWSQTIQKCDLSLCFVVSIENAIRERFKEPRFGGDKPILLQWAFQITIMANSALKLAAKWSNFDQSNGKREGRGDLSGSESLTSRL
jgi:hypothetical protein